MSDWPEGDARYDVAAYRAAVTRTERDAPALRLEPMIRRIARRVSVGGLRLDVDEFENGAWAFLLAEEIKPGVRRIDTYDTARGFEAWADAVLRHAWIDHRRRRRLPVVGANPDAIPAPQISLIPADAAFAEQDWHWLEETLRPEHLLEFLSLRGLTQQVGAEKWDELVVRYETTRGVTLPRPFPPDEIARLETVRVRTTPLAALFGYEPNRLSVRLMRITERLQQAWLARASPPTCRTTDRSTGTE